MTVLLDGSSYDRRAVRPHNQLGILTGEKNLPPA